MAAALGTGCASSRPRYRDAAAEAADWLLACSIETDDGACWRSDPTLTAARPSSQLYSGVPGVVLFLFEAARALDDNALLEQARAGADWLVQHLPEKPGRYDCGLYTGLAGVGFVLSRAAERASDPTYALAARGCLQLVLANAKRTTHGLRWTPSNDIISGSAGIGLWLIDAGKRFEDPAALRAAIATGDDLLAAAEPAPEGGREWPMSAGYARRMPNFSHGTAGIAYFLAELYAATGERRFLDAALDGARYLVAIGGKGASCRIYHDKPGGENLFYLGWCHGPAGTAQLFYRLSVITGDRQWLAQARRSAQALIDAKLPDHRTPGFWNNVGLCCGSAGVARFCLAMYRVTKDHALLDLAFAMTDDLLDRGTRDSAGLRWVQAEHRVRPDLLQAQTGLMQGAAGIGLWLLELDAFEHGRDWTLHFPDAPRW